MFLIFNKTNLFAQGLREVLASDNRLDFEKNTGWFQAAENCADFFRKVDCRSNGRLFVYYVDDLDDSEDCGFLSEWQKNWWGMKEEQEMQLGETDYVLKCPSCSDQVR